MMYEAIALDVWGNAKDGFEVNQSFHTGNHYDVPDWANDRVKILTCLKLQGCISSFKNMEVDDSHENVIYINNGKNGKPLLELWRVNE